MVVDDEKEIRDLLSIYLVEDGYDVIAAASGEEAINLAQSEDPQVILMDVKMPGIDGVETCKRLKGAERTKSIPVMWKPILKELTTLLTSRSTKQK
jgi:CheY-like chemotaxis protein